MQTLKQRMIKMRSNYIGLAKHNEIKMADRMRKRATPGICKMYRENNFLTKVVVFKELK